MERVLRPEYIAPSELAAALRDTTAPPPVVIDVRDDDFAGGHIRSAVNLPEWGFRDDDDVDAIIRKYRHAPVVVFHCMLSQVRGPRCAKRFLARLQVAEEDRDGESDHVDARPTVKVLAGGYSRFYELYKGEPDLLEDHH